VSVRHGNGIAEPIFDIAAVDGGLQGLVQILGGRGRREVMGAGV